MLLLVGAAREVMAQCTVTINNPVASPCLGDTLALSATANGQNGPFIFAWTVTAGSGVFSSTNTSNTLFSPSTSGTVTVQVTVTDTNGTVCATDLHSWSVTNASVASLTCTNAPSVTFDGLTTFRNCTPQNQFLFNFQENGSILGNAQVTIDWGDASPVFTSTGAWPPQGHLYSPPGLYTITYTVDDGVCEDTQFYNVFLGVNPGAQFGRPNNAPVCDGATVDFLITPDATNVPGTTYTVYYGDGSSAVFTHPPPATVSHTYTASSCTGGSYTVTCGGSQFPVVPAANTFTACLCVENPCGGFPPTAPNIIVHEAANAGFNAPTTACTTAGVAFSSTSTGGVIGAPCGTPYHTWSISGPGAYNLQAGSLGPFGSTGLTVQFPVPGVYTVSLTAEGEICPADTYDQQICIEPPLVPTFDTTQVGLCDPVTVALQNTTDLTDNCSVQWDWVVSGSGFCGAAAAWQWTNGNATSASPSIQFTAPGTYTIRLRALNSCGWQQSAPVSVTVFDDPQIQMGAALSLCEGDGANPIATYTTCGTPITSYLWNMPSATPSSSNLPLPGPVTINSSGTISVTVTSVCGSVTASNPVVANPDPPASTVPPGPISICQGQPLTLGATNVPGATFVWTSPLGVTYAMDTVVIPAAGPAEDGLWTVVAFLGVCEGPPATVDVSIILAPVLGVVANPSSICVGDSSTLVAVNATSYAWTIGTTPVGTGSTLVVAPTSTTTYTVEGDVGGCPGTDDITVTVNPLPVVNAGPDLSLCDQPIPELLQPVTAGGTWGAPVVGGQYTPNGQGVFEVAYDYTDANGCFNSDTITITVGPPPAPVTAGPDTLICINSGTVQLVADQPGGTWSNSVWVNGAGEFTPGAVSTELVVYTVGAGTCAVDDTVQVQVVPGATVEAGPNDQLCANDPALQLVPNPLGGTWSGNGVSITGLFDPAQAVIGPNVLTYTYPDPNGCIVVDQLTVQVDPLPVLTVTSDTTFCVSTISQQIMHSPTGGTWSGPNVDPVSGQYTPVATTPIGSPDVLVYTYTDGNGCTNTASVQVTVIDPPFVAFAGNDTAACVGNAPFPLVGDGLGGDWSGSFVLPGYAFDPSVVGTWTLTYTVGTASCETQDQVDITVDPLPPSFAGAPLTVCVYDAVQTLQGTPAGGVWDRPNTFDPDTMQLGPTTFCYTYTDPITECDSTHCTTVTVEPIPVADFSLPDSACVNTPVNFTNITACGCTWTWDFGDLSLPSTQQDPQHTYGATGTYTVQLVATSGAGCIDTITHALVITEAPTAQLTWSVADSCGDGLVQVTNDLVMANTTHTWWVNGTVVSNAVQPGSFALQGPVLADTLYTLVYEQANFCGADRDTLLVWLHPLPVASFGTDQLIYCLADTVYIGNDSYGLVDSVFWQLGDGTVSTNGSPTWFHQYVQDSTWTITLEVYNECGADTASWSVTVLPNQVTAFFSTDTVIGCAPLTSTFTNFSVGDTASIWYFGDSLNTTSISTNTGFTYTDPGTYTVQLVALGCGVDTATQVIEVLALPVVDALSDPTVCLGDAVSFSASGAGLVGLLWSFGDGDFDSIPNPTHTYANAGTYDVILTVVSNITLCPSADTIQVEVVEAPVLSLSAADTVFCVPFDLALSAAGTTGSNLAYVWTLNGDTVSYSPSPLPQPIPAPGSYVLALTVEDLLTGCSDSASFTVVGLETPVSGLLLDPYDPCGDPAQLVATSTATPPQATLAWNINGQLVGQGPVLATAYSTPGTHTLALIAELPGPCADTATTTFTLLERPLAGFDTGPVCLGQAIPITDTSSNAVAWWWYLNGAFVGNDPGGSGIVPSSLGNDTIALAVTSPDGCRDSTWVVVDVNAPPLAELLAEAQADCETVLLTAAFAPNSTYVWYVNGQPYSEERSPPYYLPPDATDDVEFALVVTNTDSCSSTDMATVYPPTCVNVPNAFTVDGDGNNELFFPVVYPVVRFREFRIFNRWGEVIFRTSDPNTGWDGTYGGARAQDGVYVWKLRYSDGNNNELEKVGHVTLLR
ncbi:MAG: PKD domain-containing protein [Flavobacteriales bacterium]|nr:PKD domain-containing protein [Flavobacteriales bacterium]